MKEVIGIIWGRLVTLGELGIRLALWHKKAGLLAVVLSVINSSVPAQDQRVLVHGPIQVQRKLALVIGNQAYPRSPLRNPVNDATSIARALRELGFDEVIEGRDLPIRRMREEINRFTSRLQTGDFALFYYAGHGVQASEQNYLIPTDWAGTSEADLEYEAYPAAQVRDKLEQSGARLRVLVLDACRNNPFRSKRDGARGLASMGSSVEGTYIAFATADNSAADDNQAENNGLFTKYLLAALRTPGLDLKQIFEKVKQDVYFASQRKQRPFTYDGVIGQYYFIEPVKTVNNPTAPDPADLPVKTETGFWNEVDKNDPESLKRYLDRYPNGRFFGLAQQNLTRLKIAGDENPAGAVAGLTAIKSEVKGSSQKPLADDFTNLQKGKELLQKVQQSLGGAEKIATVKDLQYHAQVDVETPGAVMKAKQTNSYIVPWTMRQDIELPIGKQSVYSDGQAGWLAGMQGTQALPAPVVKQVRGEVFRQILLLSLSDRDPNRTVNYAGPGALEISSKDGESARLEVDEATGVPQKVTYTEGQTVTQVFSDWREVGGVRLPYKWSVMQGERKFATVTIEDYKINSGLTPEILSKKP